MKAVVHAAITKALEGGEAKGGQAALSGVLCRYASLLPNADSTDTGCCCCS